MAIKVRFLANTRELFGKAETDIGPELALPCTVRDVLVTLAQAENKDVGMLIRSGKEGTWSAVRVVCNGRVLHSLDSEVCDGDELVVVPLLGAG